MAITKAFEQYVKDRDVLKIRISMNDSLLVDPTFNKFKEMESLALSQGIDKLYEEYNGKSFVDAKSEWNDRYMARQMNELVDNFSKERVKHVKEIISYLHPSRSVNTMSSTRNTINNGKIEMRRKHKIAAGALVGGTLGGVVAVVVNAPVVVGAVVGAAAVTVVTVLTTEGD
jgi:hypothetical protein